MDTGDNVTLGKILIGLTLSSLLGIAAMAGIAWQRIGNLEENLEHISARIDRLATRADEIKDAVTDMRRRGY